MNDETIRKIMSETMAISLDQLLLNVFLGNAHTSPGSEWVSFNPGKSAGTYAETVPETEAAPGFTWHTEYVLPADSLVIEGECREVGLKELPARSNQ